MSAELDFDTLFRMSVEADQSGRHAEGARAAESALALREDGRALAVLALHRLRLGDLKACLAAGRRAESLLAQASDTVNHSRLQGTLAVAYLQADMVQQGLAHAQRAVDLAAGSHDLLANGWAALRVAQVRGMLGEWGPADECFAKALHLAEGAGDAGLKFSVLYNRAWLSIEGLLRESPPSDAQLEGALALFMQAQSLADAEANAHSRGICLLNRSRALLGLGRREPSWTLASEALALAGAHGLVQMAVGAQSVLCEWMLREGRADEARLALLRVRESLSAEDLISQLDVLRLIVKAERQLTRYESALQAFEELHALSLRQARSRADLQAWMMLHQHEIEQQRLRTERAELDAEVQRMRATQWESAAHQDTLTGLSNRRYLSTRLPGLFQHAASSGQPLLAAILDLDHFKRINDSFGHEVGDAVLQHAGRILRELVRSRDLPVRLGGEEFLVLMPEATVEQALAVCERIRSQIEAHDWASLAAGLSVSVSIGLAAADAGESPWACADAALYRAKAQGRNRIVRG
ncbi:GGDEF domain-containing protein [Paucibacter sp. AS339]|uniref:GGDEF domain-containing protein n=1 Tax=Paucibacter hankyongi TaxID=3133434 RepID=UPI0030A85524